MFLATQPTLAGYVVRVAELVPLAVVAGAARHRYGFAFLGTTATRAFLAVAGSAARGLAVTFHALRLLAAAGGSIFSVAASCIFAAFLSLAASVMRARARVRTA